MLDYLRRFKKYLVLAAFVLALRYSRGQFKMKGERAYLALPHFLNIWISNKASYLWVFSCFLFTKYHPSSSLRYYDTCEKDARTMLYSPEQLKPCSGDSTITKNLDNGDKLVLTNKKALEKMKSEILECYGGDEKKGSIESYREEQLMQLFDMLPVVKPEDMIGVQFEGIVLPCSPTQVLQLVFPGYGSTKLGWGKFYPSKHFIEPCVFNYDKKYYFSFPVGNATVNKEQYRGKMTACMAYEIQPVKDFFALLRPKGNEPMIVMGTFMLKDKFGGFFLLKEVKQEMSFLAEAE